MNSQQANSVFVEKLWSLLQNYGNKNGLVEWTREGTAFVILDPRWLTQSFLPRYFKHCKFSSFVRQLNMYNFKKVKGNYDHQFQHQLFQRGSKHLLVGIRRKRHQKNQEFQNILNEKTKQKADVSLKIPLRQSLPHSDISPLKGSSTSYQCVEDGGDFERENQYLKQQKDVADEEAEKPKQELFQQSFIADDKAQQIKRPTKSSELANLTAYDHFESLDQNSYYLDFQHQEPSLQNIFPHLSIYPFHSPFVVMVPAITTFYLSFPGSFSNSGFRPENHRSNVLITKRE